MDNWKFSILLYYRKEKLDEKKQKNRKTRCLMGYNCLDRLVRLFAIISHNFVINLYLHIFFFQFSFPFFLIILCK